MSGYENSSPPPNSSLKSSRFLLSSGSGRLFSIMVLLRRTGFCSRGLPSLVRPRPPLLYLRGNFLDGPESALGGIERCRVAFASAYKELDLASCQA